MLTSSAGNHAVGSAGMRVRGPSSLSCSTGAGIPINLGRSKIHRITLTEILRTLEPLNEGRDNSDRITYDSLWVHAKRHYGLAGRVGYWSTRMSTEFRNALAGNGLQDSY